MNHMHVRPALVLTLFLAVSLGCVQPLAVIDVSPSAIPSVKARVGGTPSPKASTSTTTSDTPSALPSADYSATKVDGIWIAVDKAFHGPMVTHCYPGNRYRFFQKGTDLEVAWIAGAGGAIRNEYYEESLRGTLANGHTTLTGQRVLIRMAGRGPESPLPTPPPEELTYELTFDEATLQLVGTRNGKPIRLAFNVDVPEGALTPQGQCGPLP